MALNAHRVFFGPADADHFLAKLTLEPDREQLLRTARDTCRQAIRSGLQDWSEDFQESILFEAALESTTPAPPLKPKFKMQGSFAYRTLNEPVHTPPQEIDLDDGVFLPVSFLNDSGHSHPALMSAGYFHAVEALLVPVCHRNGWELVTENPSCVRVKLGGGAHIDFALYAIPDEEFDQLISTEAMTAQDQALLTEQIELSEGLYQGLREDQIMLAHRKEGWKPSDPRKLEDWFRAALDMHGEQLRRICRYLKGWRDYHWKACRLSSIALMSCVVTTYRESAPASVGNRDDLALLAVAARLPDMLNGRIANPVVDGQYLDEGWAEVDRQNFVTKATELHDWLREAITVTDSASHALASLVSAFGARIPNDDSLIKLEESGRVAAPAVLTSGLVKRMGGEHEPQQVVKREGDRRYG